MVHNKNDFFNHALRSKSIATLSNIFLNFIHANVNVELVF